MAWSHLQSNSILDTTTAAASVTYTSNVASGTKLIACVCADLNPSFDSISSVKDGAGNTMTQVANLAVTTVAQIAIYAMDTPAGDVGTTPTITATTTNNFGLAVLIQEVSGLLAGNTTAMVDGTAGSTSGTTTPATSGAYSSTAANEYLVGLVGDPGNNSTYTQTGYTADPNNVAANTAADLQVGYTNSSNGSESLSWSYSSGTGTWATLLIAFKLGGPVATVGPVLYPVPRNLAVAVPARAGWQNAGHSR